jgi:hypothetical protein
LKGLTEEQKAARGNVSETHCQQKTLYDRTGLSHGTSFKTVDTAIQYQMETAKLQERYLSYADGISYGEGTLLENKRGLIILDRIQGVSTLPRSRNYSWGVI